MRKRQRRTIGSIVEIPVEQYRIHAQVLPECDMVFFDTKEKSDPSIEDLLSSKVLFRVAANDDALLDGRWLKVGKTELKEEYSKPIPTFIRKR